METAGVDGDCEEGTSEACLSCFEAILKYEHFCERKNQLVSERKMKRENERKEEWTFSYFGIRDWQTNNTMCYDVIRLSRWVAGRLTSFCF